MAENLTALDVLDANPDGPWTPVEGEQLGRWHGWGTVLAVFFVAFATTGLTLSEVGTCVEPVFQGGALIIAVAISTVIARRRAGT